MKVTELEKLLAEVKAERDEAITKAKNSEETDPICESVFRDSYFDACKGEDWLFNIANDLDQCKLQATLKIV